ncbi:MAG: FtsW/RodA/SpoVE family cell cycle protein [Oscillospiraceae bacterium]|nr:FtsW/RodA/SpoVE family cell cycle protein [Oscillospiraceae bacterium]
MKKILNTIQNYFKASDNGLVTACVLCSAISCIMLYSIAQNELLDRCDFSTFRTQALASGLGLIMIGILSVIDYNKIIRLWWLYAPAALILVGLTFTSLGYRRAGADDQAWIAIGNFYLQPSELLKLAFILTFSFHLAKVEENMNQIGNMLLLCLHAMIPIGLVAKQGDYGTAIVFVIIFLAEILSAQIALRYILAAAAAIPLSGLIAWNFLLSDMHKNRILVILHPGTDPENLEYQQDLGIASLANGKIFGVGLQSENGYVRVPEMHNDFIYAYLGQAWGLVGSLLVLFLLTYICIKVLTDSLHAKNYQGKFICIGTFGMIFSHCFMNLGMVLKVMPVIGIPLPFMSAGGTAVVCMYTAIGIVNSTRCHNVRKHRMFYEAEPER